MKGKRSLIAIQMTAQRKRLIYLAFISLALGAAIVSQAALLAEAVQRIFVERVSFSSVALLLGILLVVMAIRTLLSYGNGTVGLQMAATAKKICEQPCFRILRMLPCLPLFEGKRGKGQYGAGCCG